MEVKDFRCRGFSNNGNYIDLNQLISQIGVRLLCQLYKLMSCIDNFYLVLRLLCIKQIIVTDFALGC